MRTLIARMTLGNGARHQRAWIVAVFLGWTVLGSNAALAQSCSGTAETIYLPLQSKITVPRDAPNGTLLTEWVIVGSPSYYGCTGSDSGSGMAFRPTGLINKAGNLTVNSGALPVAVWDTDRPGIGIAIAVSFNTGGCGSSSWYDLGIARGLLATDGFPAGWIGRSCNGAGTLQNGGWATFALVKTGPITGGGIVGSLSLFEGAPLMRANANSAYTVGSNRKTFNMRPITVVLGACKTSDFPVDMGSHPQSVFKGIGSTTGPVSFNVQVNDCPSGINSVQYQFEPVNAVLDPGKGILALSSAATAKGIGLQLKDGIGRALEYRRQYRLEAYSQAVGGSYTIPLTAAYYQTAATVQPGKADAQLRFTLTYQ
ncbi:fimbrial protein [Achromobacter anxifer]